MFPMKEGDYPDIPDSFGLHIASHCTSHAMEALKVESVLGLSGLPPLHHYGCTVALCTCQFWLSRLNQYESKITKTQLSVLICSFFIIP